VSEPHAQTLPAEPGQQAVVPTCYILLSTGLALGVTDTRMQIADKIRALPLPPFIRVTEAAGGTPVTLMTEHVVAVSGVLLK
jgi:hypothetical protein